MIGVLCDKRMPSRVKGKLYRIAAMMYGSETWAMRKAEVKANYGDYGNEDVEVDVWVDQKR